MILISSPFNSKAKLWLKGRSKIFQKLSAAIEPGSEIAWFHCSSLGEFEQGRPVIEEFKKKFSSYKILLTFFSPSGFEVRKNYENADFVFYLPLDFKGNVKRFLKIVNPKITFFVKYEFWYNYLNELKKNNMPVYIFSANFRKDQVFFKSYGKWYMEILMSFEHIFVLNKDSLDLLNSYGISNASVSGDTRFDRVFSISKITKVLPLIENFKNNQFLIIAGSTWEKDIEIISGFINSSGDEIKFIIAPHEIKLSNIKNIFNVLETKVIKYSEADAGNISDYKVMIIDNIGMLSSLYKYADIAYVGGGFSKGIHNLLEAATFGIPVLFGPNNRKFSEAADLIKLGAGFQISDGKDFIRIINELKSDKEKLINSGNAAKSYVEGNIGATFRILDDIRHSGNSEVFN
jgi:3-deoxy-D-manno-octulosonic-acid transferase